MLWKRWTRHWQVVVDEADEVMGRMQDQTGGGKVESEVAAGEVVETRDDIIVDICIGRSMPGA